MLTDNAILNAIRSNESISLSLKAIAVIHRHGRNNNHIDHSTTRARPIHQASESRIIINRSNTNTINVSIISRVFLFKNRFIVLYQNLNGRVHEMDLIMLLLSQSMLM